MNEQNLINLRDRTKEERIAIARKGALASAEVKREKKRIKASILERYYQTGKVLNYRNGSKKKS